MSDFVSTAVLVAVLVGERSSFACPVDPTAGSGTHIVQAIEEGHQIEVTARILFSRSQFRTSHCRACAPVWRGATHHSVQLWLCRCACGVEKEVITQRLRSRTTKSCGCLRIDAAASARAARVTRKELTTAEWLAPPAFTDAGAYHRAIDLGACCSLPACAFFLILHRTE